MNTKKTYIQPAVCVLTVATQQMIAVSTESLGVGSGTKDASEALSRGGSSWDDDEE